MGKKKTNYFMIWVVGIFFCGMAQVPVWGILLISAGYGLLVILLRFYQSVFWMSYLIHGVWHNPRRVRRLYDYAYTHGARAGAPMIAYAMLLMEDYRYTQALTVLREVQEQSDLNPTMRLVSRQDLAIALSKTGDIASAIGEMEIIRQEYASLGSNFYSTLAYFYIQAGELDKAETINALSQTEKANGAYYDNLATISYCRGESVQAEALFRKALEIDDTMLSPQYHLGLLAEARGDIAQAMEHFRTVCEGEITGLSTVSKENAEEKYHRYWVVCKEGDCI